MAHGLRRFFISRLLPLLEISKIGIAQEHFLVEVVQVANRRRLGQLPVLIEKVERSEHPVQVAWPGMALAAPARSSSTRRKALSFALPAGAGPSGTRSLPRPAVQIPAPVTEPPIVLLKRVLALACRPR